MLSLISKTPIGTKLEQEGCKELCLADPFLRRSKSTVKKKVEKKILGEENISEAAK